MNACSTHQATCFIIDIHREKDRTYIESAEVEQVVLTVRRGKFGSRLELDASLDYSDRAISIPDEEPGHEQDFSKARDRRRIGTFRARAPIDIPVCRSLQQCGRRRSATAAHSDAAANCATTARHRAAARPRSFPGHGHDDRDYQLCAGGLQPESPPGRWKPRPCTCRAYG